MNLQVAGRDITVTNPDKVLFPAAGHTKLELVQYYIAVADGALRGSGGRPNMLVRYPNGIGAEHFYQKRAPASRPDWLEVVSLSFPSGRAAEELVPRTPACLAWMANLACLELHPHPVRAEDLNHPDELRVDLDPVPGVQWPQIQEVARVVRATLTDLGLVGWPKTSGSRGVHVYVRIERRWTFREVRRAALALAREVERRAPALATSKWWKEERHGVFLDYNQNAKDRTVAAAYSVRPRPDARVSAPVTWEELDEANPADFTLSTMPARFTAVGDRHAGIDDRSCSIESLLDLSARHEKEGLGDAPWPPHYRKEPGEPPRVQPSKRRRTGSAPAASDAATSGAAASAAASDAAASAAASDAAAFGDANAPGDAAPPGAARAPGRGTATGDTATGDTALGDTAPGDTAMGDATAARGAATPAASGRRRPSRPLIEIARAKDRDSALAGLERWKARHPAAAKHLEPADVLVDAMRGRFRTWTRIRINLQHVPVDLRPPQEALDPDEMPDDWSGMTPARERSRRAKPRP